ncbi:hypothetical protein ANASTE_00784 [Anaerofustis stercorihominis DSM 17244]|uniref:Uncharacterized protein n=1 Tax=Anaerofustis stercorihominis DSM 17244 TaxID=445971 RepID=B1C7T0_9FIRM|nr:hypothetical protein ANASTE_00784 [Anaerofustis stercorihominis DSM 17244]
MTKLKILNAIYIFKNIYGLLSNKDSLNVKNKPVGAYLNRIIYF